MKIKRFTLLTLSIGLLGTGLFFATKSNEATYFPRNNAESPKSASGYLDYIKSIKANQVTGEINSQDVEAAYKQASRLPKGKATLGVNWNFKGPDNMGGRTRAFLIDRNNSNRLYAGGVAGGVFVSNDAGQNWAPYDTDYEVKNISCITQATDGSIYVGTGGHFETGGSGGRGYYFLGSGIHKLIGNGNYQTIVAPDNRLSSFEDFATIGQIEADPTDPNRLFVAMNNGFRIIDMSGAEPSITDPIKFNRRANDVDATADGKVLVSYQGGDLYISHNSAVHFYRNNIPRASRVECAIAPSNSNIMYASVARANSATCLEGVFRSKDGGINWERISPSGSSSFEMLGNVGVNCQGGWDNAISVYPDDPGKIIVAGVTMYRWEQSSTDPAPVNGSWNQIDILIDRTPAGNLIPFYVHADKHRVSFDPNNSDIAYIATDGGIYKSINFNASTPFYSAFNNKYAVTQYYNIGVGPNDIVLGGTQDNGSHAIGLGFNNGLGGIEVLGGDGFDADLSTVNPSIGFASSQFNRIARIQGIGSTSGNSNLSVADVTGANSFLGGLCGTPEGCSEVFYSTTKLWETFDHPAPMDSVLIAEERTDLPPIPAGTVYTYESDNSNNVRHIEQTESTSRNIYPTDTLTGAVDRVASNFNGLNRMTKVVNYDTIVVDTTNSRIFINYRDSRPDEILSYTLDNPVAYTNSFVGAIDLTVKADSLITQEFQISFGYSFRMPDKVQTIFATANWPGQGSTYGQRNVYMTRDMMRNKPNIKWFSIAGPNSSPDPITTDVLCMDFSRDGNYLFLGTQDGKLYRISNLNRVNSDATESSFGSWYNIQDTLLSGQCRQIGSFSGRSVTDVSVDQDNPDNVIVSLGNYGNGFFVSRTTIATTAVNSTGTFTSIQGLGTNGLPKAPAYTVVMDKNKFGRVLVGNEIGVFATENAFETIVRSDTVITPADTQHIMADTIIVPADSIITDTDTIRFPADTTYITAQTNISPGRTDITTGPDVIWTEETVGMGRVPVFDLEQMYFGYEYAGNDGKIYAGTHGRGIFETDQFVGLPEVDDESNEAKFKNSFKLYPNPAREQTTLDFILNERGNVQLSVFDIRGKLIKDEALTNLQKGRNQVEMNIGEMNNGTYIIRLVHQGKTITSKFVVHK